MKLKSTLIAVATVAATGAGAAAVSAQDQSAADLGVVVKAAAHKALAGKTVYFHVTVTNHGPAAATDFLIAARTRGGLVFPKVVEAPPDSVQTACQTTSTGGSSGCTTTWVPPRCHASKTVVTCRYQSLQLTAPSGPSDSVTVVLKARTGKPGNESVVVTVARSNDPNPANNRGSAVWKVRAG